MRTHYSSEVKEHLLGQDVTVCGWVHRRRDHGGVIFVDLRDRTGLVQVVFNPDANELFNDAENLRSEFVIEVTGKVNPRPEGMINAELPSGKVEIIASNMTIHNKAATPPFPLNEHQQVSEEVRLRHRYIDLRRPEMFKRLETRAKLVRSIRHFLDKDDFLDIETPMLTKATPEGARDYLVPSRTHENNFLPCHNHRNCLSNC